MLGDIRDRFIELSGRMDLSDDNVAWFINNGSRWLDTHQETSQSTRRYVKTFMEGSWRIYVPDLRVATTVLLTTASDTTKELIKAGSIRNMIRMFPKFEHVAILGMPTYWAVMFNAQNAHDEEEEFSWTDCWAGLVDISESSVSRTYVQSLAIMPPAIEVCTINIIGKWYQPKLVDDTDANFWTTDHSDLLLYASLMSLESFYRNTQGVLDYKHMIDDILIGIDKDLAESEETVSPNIMEG